MGHEYVATIKNVHTKEVRSVTVRGDNVMEAHKTAYMKHTSNDEDVESMRDCGTGDLVFDIKKGFN